MLFVQGMFVTEPWPALKCSCTPKASKPGAPCAPTVVFVILLDAGIACVALGPRQFSTEHKIPPCPEIKQETQETETRTQKQDGGLSVSWKGLGHQRVTNTSVHPLFLFPPASLKMESFIPGRRITFWEVNLSSPEIPPTVL